MVTTVTQGDWNVSTCTSSHFDGAVLNVFMGFALSGKTRKGDADGMRFAATADAQRYAYEHGYTHRYFNSGVAVAKKVFKAELALTVAEVKQKILKAKDVSEVIEIANEVRRTIQDDCKISCLEVLRWSNATYTLARKFRPEIYERNELRIAFDHALYEQYGTTVADAGLTLDDVLSWMSQWENNATDAAEAYGEKYGLVAKEVRYAY